MPKTICIKWTPRNLQRITKLLKIKHNLDGTFSWPNGNGYKVSQSNNHMYLTFIKESEVKK